MSKQYHIQWRKCQKHFYVTHWCVCIPTILLMCLCTYRSVYMFVSLPFCWYVCVLTVLWLYRYLCHNRSIGELMSWSIHVCVCPNCSVDAFVSRPFCWCVWPNRSVDGFVSCCFVCVCHGHSIECVFVCGLICLLTCFYLCGYVDMFVLWSFCWRVRFVIVMLTCSFCDRYLDMFVLWSLCWHVRFVIVMLTCSFCDRYLDMFVLWRVCFLTILLMCLYSDRSMGRK